MIINKKNPKHKKYPDTLDGMVLLEETIDPNGKVNGYITVQQDIADNMRNLTSQQRSDLGWGKYQMVLDKLPAILPKLK